MGKCKRKSVQAVYVSPAYSGIFWHIQTFSGIIRYIQELFRHIYAYSEPYVTQTLVEAWYI